MVVVAPSEVGRLPPGGRGGAPPKPVGRTGRDPKWARESAALRDALAAARKGGQGKGGGMAPPPDDANDGRVECPHCKRRFNAAAAERHIPQCQKLQTKPRAVKPR